MNTDHITAKNGYITGFNGHDATMLYRAMTIRQALKACKLGMRLTRTATPTNSLKLATSVTHKVYKRGQYDLAIADMEVWIAEMRLALPVIKG